VRRSRAVTASAHQMPTTPCCTDVHSTTNLGAPGCVWSQPAWLPCRWACRSWGCSQAGWACQRGRHTPVCTGEDVCLCACVSGGGCGRCSSLCRFNAPSQSPFPPTPDAHTHACTHARMHARTQKRPPGMQQWGAAHHTSPLTSTSPG